MFKWLKRRKATREVIEQASEVKSNKPARQVCVRLLEQLDPARFKDYEPYNYGQLPLEVLHPTAASYVEHLHSATVRIIKKERMEASFRRDDKRSVSIDQFFAIDNGFYMDPVQSIAEFKKAALNLCEALAGSDGVDVGDEEWYLRVMTSHLVNIREITTELLKISK